jgi:guanidinobutyrase
MGLELFGKIQMTNQPLGGNELARFSGPQTFMRLPAHEGPMGLDVAILGIPMDIGTSWRSGTRFGPKQIREQSAMIRPYNLQTGAAPFDSLNLGDIGDVPINTFSLEKSLSIITAYYDDLLRSNVIPVALGGDHSMTLPILRSIAKKLGPVALVHVDAHADVNEHMFGEAETHGTVFRRAYEDGCLQADKVFQIGLRGTGYGADDFTEAVGWGFNQHLAPDLWHKSLAPLAAEIKQKIGDTPVYISYDIDSLDPAYAPGTGTPEIGGLTTMQAMELIRGLRGLNIVGCDLVEVSPPYDTSGNTALTAANLVYELLCVLPKVAYR